MDINERSYTPTRYEYAASSSGGGVLQLEIGTASVSAGAALEGFGAVYPPEIYVGDMLWLDRTLSVGAAAGTMIAGLPGGGRDLRPRAIEVLAV